MAKETTRYIIEGYMEIAIRIHPFIPYSPEVKCGFRVYRAYRV